MSIVDREYLIKNIHLVMSSVHKKKKITSNLNGRYSDCFAYVLFGTTNYTFTNGQSFQANSDDVIYLSKLTGISVHFRRCLNFWGSWVI